MPLRFVAKRELLRRRLFARCLRRLGVGFVERVQAQRGVLDAQRLARIAGEGSRLCVFAEGTFRRAPGLLGFHLGAFRVAVQARVPVVPMALRGTRDLLPDETWWPRRCALQLVIGDARMPSAQAGDEFAEAARLMRASREFVLDACGEPDAAHVLVVPA